LAGKPELSAAVMLRSSSRAARP